MPEIILLDTHAWLWYVNGNTDQYPENWTQRIATAALVGISPVSCYEIALAEKRGRIKLNYPAAEWFSAALDAAGVELLPLTPAIAMRAVNLTPAHRDPFDRIIIATALEQDALIATVDGVFTHYPELNGRILT
jgi:PIN domain nuclease of toxin-antitoxin system